MATMAVMMAVTMDVGTGIAMRGRQCSTMTNLEFRSQFSLEFFDFALDLVAQVEILFLNFPTLIHYQSKLYKDQRHGTITSETTTVK